MSMAVFQNIPWWQHRRVKAGQGLKAETAQLRGACKPPTLEPPEALAQTQRASLPG